MKLENYRKNNYSMEAEQHASKKKTMGQWWNQRGHLKLSWDNDIENITMPSLWDAAKAVLRGTFRAIQSYFKKWEKSQVNNLNLHIKQLEREEQTKISTILKKERSHKDQNRNKWYRDKEKNSKDQ